MTFIRENGTSGNWGTRTVASDLPASIDEGLRSHMLRVYNWMASGLLVTALVAYAVANIPEIRGVFFNVSKGTGGLQVDSTALGFVMMFAPLAFILVLSFGINRLSAFAAQALFWAFCAVMGVSMTNILLMYTGASVASTFLITSGMFAAISIYGYTTKSDLTRMGSFMMMGLLGLVIAGLVNVFLQSSALQFALSVLGVVIFVGMTAYDTQRIKSEYRGGFGYLSSSDYAKASVMDALTLYLNFINLFRSLISLMGVRTTGED